MRQGIGLRCSGGGSEVETVLEVERFHVQRRTGDNADCLEPRTSVMPTGKQSHGVLKDFAA